MLVEGSGGLLGKAVGSKAIICVQHLVALTFAKLVVHEVDAPDMVRMRRP